ncbi:MAG: MerR family transcriptional regulator [Coprobacillaceae bacterium]
MLDKEYYSVGEISKICNVNIRTLHYYDEIGLLTPEKIDEKSRYRYYSNQQVFELMMIKEFKFIGFSLKEVKNLLKRDDIDFNRDMLVTKCAEIDKTIQSLSLLKERLQRHVSVIEDRFDETDKGEIYVKEVKESFIAYIDCEIALTADEIGKRFVELTSKLDQKGIEIIGDRFAIFNYESDVSNYDKVQVRVFIPVQATKEIRGFIEYMPAYKVVAVMRYGSYGNLYRVYNRLYDYTKLNNVKTNNRIVNHFIIDTVSSIDKREYISEIMLMVEK